MFKELFSLFFTFFKIGAVTFGGGYAMLPILERELAQKRGWTTPDELIDYYSIAQVTPGIIAVNVATFIGYKRRKVSGAAFATLGIVTPSLIIITLIALLISNFQSIEWIQKALEGINIGVAALLTYSSFKIGKKALRHWYCWIIYAASFAAAYVFHIHTFIIITCVISCSVAVYFIKNALERKNTEDGQEQK